MVPESINSLLNRLRRREVGQRLAWGAGRSLAAALAALALFCAIDFAWDRVAETPTALRAGMLVVQLLLWFLFVGLWIIGPAADPPADDALALQVESGVPELDHRLISAVQLNRPQAKLGGMSGELVAAFTEQAKARAAAIEPEQIIDGSRTKRALALALPPVFAALVFFAVAPELTAALLARQFLSDVEIPRRHYLEPLSTEIWPAGEEVTLRFRVTANGLTPEYAKSMVGEVVIRPDSGPTERYELKYESFESTSGPVFAAVVPAGSSGFSYRGYIADGRTATASRIKLEPRPTVNKLEATVLLPTYYSTRPDGKPYERPQPRGDAAGPADSSIRVNAAFSKPVKAAEIELLHRPPGSSAPEITVRTLPISLAADGLSGVCLFELRENETGYRVTARDTHGFANIPPPRRSLSVLPDQFPRVVLLRESFPPGAGAELGFSADYDVDGMPVPVNGAVRLAFACAHPYGLGKARLKFRLVPEGAEERPWQYLPLTETLGTEAAGPFELRTGLFRNSKPTDTVEFHAALSPDPWSLPGRLEGGGSFDFLVKGVPGVKPGDSLEFVIEVFDRKPGSDRQPGISETRLKAVVTEQQFVEWLLQTLQQESRIRQLEAKQRTIFGTSGNK